MHSQGIDLVLRIAQQYGWSISELACTFELHWNTVKREVTSGERRRYPYLDRTQA
jgi:hypothetical protein